MFTLHPWLKYNGLCEISKCRLNKFQLCSIPSIVSSVNKIHKAKIIYCAISVFWKAKYLSPGISMHPPLQHEKFVYTSESTAFLKGIVFQTIGCAVHWNGFNVQLCFKYINCVKKNSLSYSASSRRLEYWEVCLDLLPTTRQIIAHKDIRRRCVNVMPTVCLRPLEVNRIDE